MCVVSMLVDSARQQWPEIQHWPAPAVVDMSEIIKKLAAIDEKLGAKDCYDPKKQEFLDALDRRLKAIEAYVREEKQAKLRAETNFDPEALCQCGAPKCQGHVWQSPAVTLSSVPCTCGPNECCARCQHVGGNGADRLQQKYSPYGGDHI